MGRVSQNGRAGDSASRRVRSRGFSLTKKESLVPFSLVLFFLFLEYGRPQDILHFLAVLHLPAVTIVILAFAIILSGKMRFNDRQTILFIFMLGLMVIHGPIAVNNYWTLMIFITMSINFVIFLSLIHFVDDTEKFNKLVKVWLGIHVFLAVMGIVKKGRGIGGFLGDENDFCMTMNMILPFSFFLAMSESGKKRMYYVLLTCLFLFVIILTESRGGFVGLSATLVYCWFRTKRKVLTAIMVGFLAVFAVLIAPPSYWDEVRSITEEGTRKGTGEERVYTWGIAWHMFLDNPVIGVGQGNFPWEFRKYEVGRGFGEEGFHGRSVAGRAAHSIYFTALPELGLIGSVMFIWMILRNLKDLNMIKKKTYGRKGNQGEKGPDTFYYIALALEGSLLSYLVSGIFISTLYYPNFWILTGFIVSTKKFLCPADKNSFDYSAA